MQLPARVATFHNLLKLRHDSADLVDKWNRKIEPGGSVHGCQTVSLKPDKW